MLKRIISVLVLLTLSFQSMADVAATDIPLNPLYESLENKKFDKPYTQFIEPLSKIIGTTGPTLKGLNSLEYVQNVTGLEFSKFYETPIIEQERKIIQSDFKTNGYSSKAADNFVFSFFVVNNKVQKIILNVQSRYEDKYYLLTLRGSCFLCVVSQPDEATDNMAYFKKKMKDTGWVLDNPVGSFFSGNYVFTKGDIELVVSNGAFYPLEIDIKRKDLSAERYLFDDLAKLDREMLHRSVEETRKKRFQD